MITIEYKGKIIEIPLNIWLNFEEEQEENLGFLGDETDIILDNEKYNKLKIISQNSKIGKKIIGELTPMNEI